MSEQVTLEIAFPVLNEQADLRDAIERTIAFCHSRDLRHVHITIADNGSTDGTPSIGRALASGHPCVGYLRLEERGVGRALTAAWSQSACDYVGYMDVDLATDLEHLATVYTLCQDGMHTVINGTRLHPHAKVYNRRLLRTITSRSLNFLLKAVLHVSFSDGMCGFKFMRRTHFLRLNQEFPFTPQWFFNAELLIKSEWLQADIYEIPVHWVDDRKSKIRLCHHVPQFLHEIARIRRERTQFLQRARADQTLLS